MDSKRQGMGKIQRVHVEQACREFLHRSPPRRGGSYFIRFDDQDLPAKLILKEAYKLANHDEVSSKDFSGGTYTARILEALNFEIVVRTRVLPASAAE
jgi:hypothetical protein